MNIVTLLTTTKLLTSNNGGQNVVEFGTDYTGPSTIVFAAKSDAGTTPSLSAKIQNSATLSIGPSFSTQGAQATQLRTAATSAIQIGQQFVLATDSTFNNIVLPLKSRGTLSACSFVCNIYSDSAGSPSASLATSNAVSANAILSAFSGTSFTFTNPVDVAAGTYWVTLSGNATASTSNNLAWRGLSALSGCKSAVYDASWNLVPTVDQEFYAQVYNFSDLTTFVPVSTTPSVQVFSVNIDDCGALRTYATIGGTNAPAFYASVIVATQQNSYAP